MHSLAWLVVVMGAVLLALALVTARYSRKGAQLARQAPMGSDKDDTAPMNKSELCAPPPDSGPPVALPKLSLDDGEDIELTIITNAVSTIQVPTTQIVYDDDAVVEEQTGEGNLIVVTASARSDRGRRRERNEDSLLVLEEDCVFVVADGMGGYNGGEVASRLAVDTMERAFRTQAFAGEPHSSLPWRASELARSVQMANEAILQRATLEAQLVGMGTTVCATRFALRKQRMYVAHVGDSRVYRLRDTCLEQITSDHTMSTLGITGAGAAHLSRAVGVWPTVPVDVILGKPLPGDIYLLCSDGLSKMLSDSEIRELLIAHAPAPLGETAHALVEHANAAGGRDNVSVILVQVFNAHHRAATRALENQRTAEASS